MSKHKTQPQRYLKAKSGLDPFGGIQFDCVASVLASISHAQFFPRVDKVLGFFEIAPSSVTHQSDCLNLFAGTVHGAPWSFAPNLALALP